MDARQVLSSQWAFRSTLAATALRNTLKAFLAEKDQILVAEIGKERASRHALTNLAEV